MDHLALRPELLDLIDDLNDVSLAQLTALSCLATELASIVRLQDGGCSDCREDVHERERDSLACLVDEGAAVVPLDAVVLMR